MGVRTNPEQRTTGRGRTQQEISLMLGISRERVRQIEDRALTKLRVALLDIGIERRWAKEKR